MTSIAARSPELDVMLISMPMAPLYTPSIGLGLLAASVEMRSFSCRTRYFTLDLARKIGDDAYRRLAEGCPARFLLGEWLFAHALFDECGHTEDYIESALANERIEDGTLEIVDTVRSLARDFILECLEELKQCPARIVGFTSTFQQHVASLALARAIREHLPDTVIVFGGANCESVMGAETLRQFPFVDIVISGEADEAFPALVAGILNGENVPAMPGVYLQCEAGERFAQMRFENTHPVENLDSLPYVSYDSYFDQFAAAAKDFQRKKPDILFETSRGCWWGEKSHCTFCGLNGTGMAYRSKSPARALAEFCRLAERYPGCSVNAVDNILNMDYFRSFIPALADLRNKTPLFFETKANLKKSQLALMKAAGIVNIQPGIESLASSVLRRMGKGVAAIQNIQLLKFCREVGVNAHWNIIFGFPGEDPGAYAAMARLVPLLVHLMPPTSSGRIHLDRFSPNFKHAAGFGFTNVRPIRPYCSIFPFEGDVLSNLAYSFDYDYQDGRDVQSYVSMLLAVLAQWRCKYEESGLFYSETNGEMHVWDLRLPLAPGSADPVIAPRVAAGTNVHVILDEVQRLLLLGCDEIASVGALRRYLHRNGGMTVEDGDIHTLLEPLIRSGFILYEDGRYLSLVLPIEAYSPSSKVIARYLSMVFDSDEPASPGKTTTSINGA